MKTIEEFIRQIESSAALQDELKAIKDKDALAAFLKKNDVDVTVEQFAEAKDIIAEVGVELTDEEVADIAGGVYRNPNTRRPNDDTHIKAPKANGNYV